MRITAALGPGLALALALGACTQFPELDAATPADVARAPYPRLQPIDPLLDAPDPRATPELGAAVTERAAGLQARAPQPAAAPPRRDAGTVPPTGVDGAGIAARRDALRARAAAIPYPQSRAGGASLTVTPGAVAPVQVPAPDTGSAADRAQRLRDRAACLRDNPPGECPAID